MSRLKTIILCTGDNFRKWKSTPRIWVLALAILAFGMWDYGSMSAYAREVYGGMTSWVLPFSLQSPTMVMVYGCITVAFFCNAPFSDRHMPFLIIRSGRLNWILGQVLYIVLAAAVYVGFYFLVSVICMLPNVGFANEWGWAEKAMAAGDQALSDYSITLRVDSHIVDYFTPVEATGLMMFLMWGVAVFSGMLIMMFNLISKGTLGVAISGILIFMSYFFFYLGRMFFGEYVLWISPFSWCTMWGVDFWDMGDRPSFSYAAIVLMVSSVIMAAVSALVYCRRDINVTKEEF